MSVCTRESPGYYMTAGLNERQMAERCDESFKKPGVGLAADGTPF